MTKTFLKQHKNRVAKNTAECCKYDKKGDGDKHIIIIITNRFGQQLRSPAEFNQHAEGFTPFGDE